MPRRCFRRSCRRSNSCRRGDDPCEERLLTSASEQPPQARGRRPGDVQRGQASRAIPAGAGTTPAPARAAPSLRSNPRRRGNDCQTVTRSVQREEQPPQARGRHARRPGAAGSPGATPAGAGTTSHRNSPLCACASNPRRRGDDLPPLDAGRTWSRATPAGAGTTPGAPGRPGVPGSNPRRRGDDYLERWPGDHELEQPPQARGRQFVGHLPHGLGRATPAGAGTTPCQGSGRHRTASNPRRRGDDLRRIWSIRRAREQPPQARGRQGPTVHRV